MNLGFWLFPWTWGQDFLDTVVSFFYSILLTIDCIIYSFVSYVYKIFLVLAQGGKIFDDRMIDGLINRLYLILGVVMLFILAYSLLKSMINPDEIAKSKNSPIHIIRDVIIAIALIAFMPTIFNFAYSFQNSLLMNNTIGKLIVGSATTNPVDTINKGGYTMAATIFKSFYHANATEEVVYCNDKDEEDDRQTLDGRACEPISVGDGQTWGELWEEAEKHTTFWVLGRAAPNILSGEVTYYFLIAPVAGIFVLFVLLTYCFDMALRLVKLAVYEIIAPIPVLARIVPNEQAKKVFNNWVKATITTFVEVFIRIAMLYFAVLLINTVVGSIDDLFKTSIKGGASIDVILLAKALIVVGIIMFVKQAPEIIKEITGLDSGKYNPFKAAKQGLSFLAGGIAGRTPLAAYRAMRQAGEAKDFLDFSAIGNQYMNRLKKQKAQKENASRLDRANDALRKRFGFETKKERSDRLLEENLQMNGDYFKFTNDTDDKIELVDDNGKVYRTIAKGEEVELDEKTLNALLHKKDVNSQNLSALDERIRQIKDGQNVDQKYIDWRGKIKKKALEKINEGHNHVKSSLRVARRDASGNIMQDANGNTIYDTLTGKDGQVLGNMTEDEMRDYIDKRERDGASKIELKQLREAFDNANADIYKEYLNQFARRDTSGNIMKDASGKIIYDEVALDKAGLGLSQMNYASMLAYKQGRINAGASQREIQQLEEAVKAAEDKMWVDYSNWAIEHDKGGEISTWYEQAKQYHDKVGIYNAETDKMFQYDATSLQEQTSKVSYVDAEYGEIHNSMALFESKGIEVVDKDTGEALVDADGKRITERGFDKTAKKYANAADTKVQDIEIQKIKFDDETKRIDRMNKQLEEAKTKQKSSAEYMRYKASDAANKINDSGKK